MPRQVSEQVFSEDVAQPLFPNQAFPLPTRFSATMMVIPDLVLHPNEAILSVYRRLTRLILIISVYVKESERVH
jgi:hypothetical protein